MVLNDGGVFLSGHGSIPSEVERGWVDVCARDVLVIMLGREWISVLYQDLE